MATVDTAAKAKQVLELARTALLANMNSRPHPVQQASLSELAHTSVTDDEAASFLATLELEFP